MAWELPLLSSRLRPSNRVMVVFLLLLNLAVLVHAQQPVSDLGSWPPGAITLLVGLWLSNYAIMTDAFDSILPFCLPPLIHRIPGMKLLMWSKEPMGMSIKSLVFSNYTMPHGVPEKSKTDNKCGVWEWDILSIYRGTEHMPQFWPVGGEQGSEEDRGGEVGECEFKMTIKTPSSSNLDIHLTFMVKISEENINGANDALQQGLKHAHHKLWMDLDQPSADNLILFWHGLRAYQATKTLHHMWFKNPEASRKKYTFDQIANYVRHDNDQSPWTPKPGNEKIKIFVTDSPADPNEVSNGGHVINDVLSMKHLVAILVYTQNFPKPLEVNPLVPLLWWWSEGYLPTTDNLFFTLPSVAPQKPSKKPATAAPLSNTLDPISIPIITDASGQQNVDLELAPTCCVIPLSRGIPKIDGAAGLIIMPRMPWIWSMISGGTITFFTALVGNANPSLATSIGLLMLRPSNIDANSIDAGRPPSWNGRKRIRWGDGENGYACGIFSGQTRVQIGRLGNCISRGITFTILAWLTWYWQTELRHQLSFSEPQAPRRWVMWIGFMIEVFLAVIIFYGAWLYHTWRQNVVTVTGVFCVINLGGVAGLMLWYLRTGKGLPVLFYLSEAFSIIIIISSSITFIGIGNKSTPVQALCTAFWLHIVASSCFRWM